MNKLNIKERSLNKNLIKMRQDGYVPGSISKNSVENMPIKISKRELAQALKDRGSIYKIDTKHGVRFVKFIEVEKDPVKQDVLHFSMVELSRESNGQISLAET